jgi:calcineurin-like phosphoesterase family protein
MSDPHYFHKNIAGPKVSKWKDGYRDFEDEIQMSRHIVKQINKTVAWDDTLYCLGDWSFQGVQNIWNFRKQVVCQTIHLTLGNHDQHIQSNKELPNVVSINGNLVSKDSPDIISDPVYARDIFTSVQDVITATYGQHTFFMSHYKHAIWYGSHKGVLHIYGHSHSNAEDWVIGKSMDVGIDNAKRLLGEYRPFSIEEVISLMDKREIKKADHHDKHTDI